MHDLFQKVFCIAHLTAGGLWRQVAIYIMATKIDNTFKIIQINVLIWCNVLFDHLTLKKKSVIGKLMNIMA